MAGYSRQNSYNNGDTIDASDTNDEFTQLVAAFDESTGHAHDGTADEGPVIGLIGDPGSSPINKVEVDSVGNAIGVFIDVGGSSVEQVRFSDGAMNPVTDSDVSLGTTLLRYSNVFTDALDAAGDITVGGTVDGRDIAADGIRLDSMEDGATADQTPGEIKTAYESNSNTNAFTDAEQTKLGNIEDNATADQTAGEIKTAYESNSNTNAFTDAEQTKLSNLSAPTSGSWTPNISGTANGQTYASRSGTYIQMGDVVIATFSMVISSLGTLTGVDSAYIGGLPVPGVDGMLEITQGRNLNITAGNSLNGYVTGTRARLEIWNNSSGSEACYNLYIGGSGELRGTIIYRV